MKFKILLFGICRELVESNQITWELAGGQYTVRQLKADLFERYPDLQELNSLLIAINNEYADEDQLINETDEVALIPPVSGG